MIQKLGGRTLRASGSLFVLMTLFAAGAMAEGKPSRKVVSKPMLEKILEKARRPMPPALRYGEPDRAEAWFRLKRAPVGETAVPVERYFQALEQMRTMRQHSTVSNTVLPSRAELEERGIASATAAATLGSWTSLGPGNVGGRTRTLVIDPVTPRILYAGGVAGGVWKTTDSGRSWRPVSDQMANLSVGILAMDPANPNVLYAGTGEGYFNGDAVRGAGIFRTTDAGATWTRLAATATPDFYYVNDLVMSSQGSGRLYAATRTGVWRSLDAGATWTRVLEPGMRAGCLDLAIRYDKTDDVVLASCGSFADEAAVFQGRKAQAAGTWTKVLKDKGMGRTSLAVAPSNPKVVYALAASNVPGPKGQYLLGLHGVFRSDDGGATWSARVRNTDRKRHNTLLLTNPVIANLAACDFADDNAYYNQGWYDNVIAVDPLDANRVWAGGIDLFRSDDGGKNWGLASYWWAQEGGRSLPSYAHADQHAIVFHPRYNGTTNRQMFVGNDGGIFKTLDARAAKAAGAQGVCSPYESSVVWTNLNNGYGVTQFYHGVPYPDGATWVGGTQDNGTIRGSEAAGPNGWREILGGDGGYVAVHRVNPDVVYATLPGFLLAKSTNGGQDWDVVLAGIDEDPNNFLFIAPLLMDPTDEERLWAGGSFVWRTDDGAENWDRASAKLAGQSPSVSAIGVARSNPDRVLAGTSEGYIHRTGVAQTANANTVWPNVRPRAGVVSSLTFDPKDANVAYATYSNFGGTHVWKSTDGGATWVGIDGSGSGKLPDIPVHVLVVDPVNRSRLWIGTDLGVFATTDGGATWAVENTGFPNVVTEWLTLETGPGNAGTIFAFTHGRGAWKVSTQP